MLPEQFQLLPPPSTLSAGAQAVRRPGLPTPGHCGNSSLLAGPSEAASTSKLRQRERRPALPNLARGAPQDLATVGRSTCNQGCSYHLPARQATPGDGGRPPCQLRCLRARLPVQTLKARRPPAAPPLCGVCHERWHLLPPRTPSLRTASGRAGGGACGRALGAPPRGELDPQRPPQLSTPAIERAARKARKSPRARPQCAVAVGPSTPNHPPPYRRPARYTPSGDGRRSACPLGCRRAHPSAVTPARSVAPPPRPFSCGCRELAPLLPPPYAPSAGAGAAGRPL